MRKFKPIEGVSFVQYDRYGNKVDPSKAGTEEDHRQYIADEDDRDGFTFIPAPQEQMEKALQMHQKMQFRGGRVDVDKKVEEMNEDEKEVFATMQEAEAQQYEEIDDDFILMLNGGVAALELTEEEK